MYPTQISEHAVQSCSSSGELRKLSTTQVSKGCILDFRFNLENGEQKPGDSLASLNFFKGQGVYFLSYYFFFLFITAKPCMFTNEYLKRCTHAT
mmetsp:Transcript_16075/g.27694  ORF Transcript_16075/g.27694 Transcript_16075/m.27694 type:complete len:94 (-) Transcript_16075:903-1184(-)